MRIRFITSIAGTRYSHKPGDVVTWPDKAEAQRFIDTGAAVLADAPSVVRGTVPGSQPASSEKADDDTGDDQAGDAESDDQAEREAKAPKTEKAAKPPKGERAAKR